MKTLHTKSPCCQGKIYHFGNRRRRCILCGKTWTVRPKKRGRKSYRVNKELLRRVLLEGRTIAQEMSSNYPSLPALRKRFRRFLASIMIQPRQYKFLSEYLILLADGLWFAFRKENWILYLMALKPTDDNKAVLLDPVLLRGGESYENWQAAFSTIPDEVKERIVAFVSDNFRASQRLAHQYRWVHQLCHFHLIAQLQIRRGKRKGVIQGKNIREKIYQTIRKALEVNGEQDLDTIKFYLQRLSSDPDCPKKMKMIVNEFLKSIKLYRAYLLYPELNLPTTTNTIESTGKIIRKVCRTLKSPKALYLWSKALARLRSQVVCNGKHFQQN